MAIYKEDEYLMLSGLQHFEFCPRQWALIHIEQQWAENVLTVEGSIFHENAHNREFTEVRGDLLISRGMAISSSELGVTGVCDVVEFHKSKNGVEIFGREGRFIPCPIEYKKGKPKQGEEDVLQLAAQAMCLEEMLCCNIDLGYLYYGETKKRVKVEITAELRERVKEDLLLMHQYYRRRYTPNTKPNKRCRACSINEVCLPKRNKFKSVGVYIEKSLKGESL